MATSKKSISTSIDANIVLELTQIATEKGMSRSELLRQYITAGMNGGVAEAPRVVVERVLTSGYTPGRFKAYDKLFESGRISADTFLTKFTNLKEGRDAVLDYAQMFSEVNTGKRTPLKRGALVDIDTNEKFEAYVVAGVKTSLKDYADYAMDMGREAFRAKADKYIKRLEALGFSDFESVKNMLLEYVNEVIEVCKAFREERQAHWDARGRANERSREEQHNADEQYREYARQQMSSPIPIFFDEINDEHIMVENVSIYKKMARIYHPDVCSRGREYGETKMVELNILWDEMKLYHNL